MLNLELLFNKIKYLKFKHLKYLLLIVFSEKRFESNGKSINYLFFPCMGKKKKGLIISFGGWPGPTYNRLRGYYEQERKKYDLLYLQDCFGHRKQGVFYLAQDGDFGVEKIYSELILETIKKSQVSKEKVYCLGGSMGGFAALYFGYKLSLGKIVAIAPIINIQKVYQNGNKTARMIYRRIIKDGSFRLDKYIFKNFDKKIKTKTAIIFHKEDGLTIRSEIYKLIKIIKKNKNPLKVKVINLPMPKDPKITIHSIAMYYMDRKKVMRIFEKG